MTTETRINQTGRPVDHQKTQQIFAAIDEILSTDGIARLSIERIASTAKISKVTLYRRFSSLEGVIRAYVESFTLNAVKSATTTIEPQDQDSLAQALNRLGIQLMTLISQPRVIAFDNAIAAAGSQLAGLKDQLFRNGPQRAVAAICQILEQGNVHSPTFEPIQLADMLFQLWKSDFYDELRFTGTMPLTPSQLEQHVGLRTQFFLNLLKNQETL
ncbi:TetR/AcrR family transcriptional regulator [Photobacterium atrarenae]|uniref:TetR/AcrR family transcriptional regulator n=1 Tax=Photobacterium atrarenae TaxID=865757 RepID=A0ABY5GBW4_9GAMM|nr:TetR/AcrR family transcriptional regulator [Photobacterium atrarenae]UTV26689.1 TetR/AcrR family transcriptional regulator [Photobacterium atrarenae]